MHFEGSGVSETDYSSVLLFNIKVDPDDYSFSSDAAREKMKRIENQIQKTQ